MKTGSNTKSRNIFISSLMTVMVACLVLTGVFLFAPIKAHAEYCNVGGCQGSFSEHGICDDEGHYQPATLNGGVYEISNYGQFLWFAEQVNSGVGVSYNAKLTNDIAFSYRTTIGTGVRPQLVTTYRDFVQVGTSLSASYRGTFDGNGFALTGIKIDEATLSNVGVFGYLNGGTVKNLEVTGLRLNGNQYVGGLVGYSMNGTIENVMTGGTVNGVDSVGGIVGYADSTTVKNSWSNATLTATTNKGGIVGQVFSTTSNIENCYYLNTKADVGFNGDAANGVAEAKTSAQFSSGEVTYLLGESWGQNIDNGSAEQSTPQLFSEARTYKALSCEGDGTVVYTNNSSVNENSQTHLWNTSGFCRTNDSHYQPAKMTTDQHDVDGDGDTDSVYEIANVGNLFWFAGHLATGNGDCNAILLSNLTVNTGTVTEDGSSLRKWVTSGEFNGIFEGNGKTISGLWSNVGGLFTTNYGTIRNLGVKNSYISQTTFASLGTIANGNAATGKIENCFSEATVVGVDGNDVDVYENVSFTGGIVGSNLGTVQNCYNTGAVTAQGYVGGIAGGLSANSVISACYNTGEVTATKNTGYAGGIVGSTAGASGDAVIKDCYNLGSVTANQYAGGIFGRRINVSTYISNCYNLGDIIAINSFGPITGESATDNVTNCYYDGIDFVSASSSGHMEYKTTEAFASGEVAYLLGSAWGQNIDSGTAQSYPVLGGKAVYRNNEANAYCDAYVYSNTDTDIFPTLHHYDTTTGICSHCKYQGEAKIGEVVYNTFAEAFEAAKGMTRPTITVLKSIEVGNVTYRIESGSITIEGSEGISIGGRGDEYYVFESLGGSIELENITVYSSNIYGAPVAARDGGYILISEGAVLSSAGCDSGAYAVDGGYIQLQGGTIKNVKYGITYACVEEPTANVILLYGSIEATEYAVYYNVLGRDCVASVSLMDMFDTWSLELSAPIFLSTGSKIVSSGNLSNWGPFEIEMETPGEFITTNSTSLTMDRTRFVSTMEGLYVQYNTGNNSLYLGECDHNELSYKKTGTYKVTETCAVCGGANEVELHAPADLVYSASAKQATVTGSFFHSQPSAITYCCDGGCKNVLGGKTHTATVTIGSYTLTKNFVIQKAPGTASVTIQGWKLGDDPNAPVPSSQTNGANGITYYYKLADADDSTYTTTVPTAEGQYILKAVFAAGDNYEEVTAYANFAIGKEMPEYTVPTGLAATYGDLLSSVTLPEGWSWKDGEQTVGNAGTNEFVAVFTPEDTEKYLSPEVLVQVEVAKANVPIFTLSQTEFTYVEGMVLDFRAYLSGGYDGANVILPIRTTEGTTYDYTFDYNNGVISKMTEAGITFRLYVQVNSTENYNRYLEYFTVTIHKGTQNFTVSPSIQSPTIVDEVELIASGNAGAVTYTTTDQYLTVNGNVLTATRVGKRTITATAAETDLYEAATKTVEVTYYLATGDKAPDYVMPTNLTVCVGHSAFDISLPEGWEWTTDSEFTTVKSYTVAARFTPADTVNFNPANINLTVVVTGHTGGTAASCTTDQVCTECGEVLVEALGHNYNEQVDNTVRTTAANCQECNTYWYDCSRCGASAKNDANATDKWYPSNEAGEHKMSSDWTSENGQHFHKCTVNGCDHVEDTEDCDGGRATCQAKAICATCGASYGELGDHNYNYGSWGYSDENGHAYKCIYCDAHTALEEHEPNAEAATEHEAKYCTFCGYVIEQQLNHVHSEGTAWEYDSEYHWHDCVANDGQVYSKDEHTYDHACDTTCNVCNATRTITHDYSKLEKNDTEHWYVCSVCGSEKANSRVAHSGGTRDCQHKAECATCGQTYGEFGNHDYDTTVWVSVGDLNHAHKCRLCDAYTDETEHFSLDEATYTEDKLCDACGHKMADALGFELNNVVYKILTNEEGNYTVEVYGNTLTEATEVIIPATVNDEGIEYTVVSIGEDAFRNSTYLTGVTICEGVGSIAKSAFENCNALLYAELPQSIYAIGIGAFCNCSELRMVNIPYTVNVIEEWTFNGCHKLENIEIHESIFKIGYRAFYNCYTLPSVVIPYSVETLDKDAFYGCTGLEEMRIYSMEVEIGENAIPTDIPVVYCEGAESTAAKYCAENGISFQTHEGEHVDKDKNHICDYGCSEALGVCEDNNFDHNCDYGCEKTYGEHSDGDDNNHLCDYGCEKIADDGCYDTVVDGKCDECGENIIHDCKDDNKNHECDICGTAIGNHSDSITDKDHLCDYGCGAVMENCVPNADDGDCTTDIICSICGAITTEGAASHIGGNATCTEKAECTVCGKEYGELVPHSHGSEWKNDADEHWNECECGDKANKAAHVDDNGDNKCDTCDYTMPAHDPDTPPVDNTPTDDNDGLGTGAIIGIVVAAVAVVGGGGFAIFWFVIRKKRR